MSFLGSIFAGIAADYGKQVIGKIFQKRGKSGHWLQDSVGRTIEEAQRSRTVGNTASESYKWQNRYGESSLGRSQRMADYNYGLQQRGSDAHIGRYLALGLTPQEVAGASAPGGAGGSGGGYTLGNGPQIEAAAQVEAGQRNVATQAAAQIESSKIAADAHVKASEISAGATTGAATTHAQAQVEVAKIHKQARIEAANIAAKAPNEMAAIQRELLNPAVWRDRHDDPVVRRISERFKERNGVYPWQAISRKPGESDSDYQSRSARATSDLIVETAVARGIKHGEMLTMLSLAVDGATKDAWSHFMSWLNGRPSEQASPGPDPRL